MATQALTKDIFEQTIEDNDIVLIDFWASWCGPCRAFAPVYEKVSEAHPGIVFGKVDTEAEPELAGSLPHPVDPDADGRARQDRALQPARRPPRGRPRGHREPRSAALDMEAVRREIAESEAAHEHEHGPDCQH